MNSALFTVNGIDIDENLFDYYQDLARKKSDTRSLSSESKKLSDGDIESYAKYEVFKRAILLNLSEKKGIRITEKELEKKLYMLTLQYSSVEEFKKDISNLTIGYERYLKIITEDLKIEKYLRELFPPEEYSIDISEVVDYYDKNKDNYSSVDIVRVSHILKNVADEEDKDTMHAIFDSLIAIKHMDKPFEELAETFSECPSKQNSGDLGFIKRGMMPIDFENVAFKLEVNEISSVVKTPMGLHVIKCTEKLTGFDAVKDDIEYFLINEKILDDIEGFVKGELSNAEIKEL